MSALSKYLGILLLVSVLGSAVLYYKNTAEVQAVQIEAAKRDLDAASAAISALQADASKVEQSIEYRDRVVERVVKQRVYYAQQTAIALSEVPEWASTPVPASVLASLFYASADTGTSEESSKDSSEEVPGS